MAIASNLGFPRIGARRELKRYLEDYWSSQTSEDELRAAVDSLRLERWRLQDAAGITHIPSNDAPFYDHMLDLAVLFSLVPARFRNLDLQGLSLYFAMARGITTSSQQAAAMEMTKWFDTNYHYIAPEFEESMRPSLGHNSVLEEYTRASEAGFITRPVVVGPLTLLRLGKFHGSLQRSSFLQALVETYCDLLAELADAGVEWLQIDEPVFALTNNDDFHKEAQAIYSKLKARAPKMLLSVYFGGVGSDLDAISSLPCEGLHLDCVRGDYRADDIATVSKDREYVSLGVIDGRNIWRTELRAVLRRLDEIAEKTPPSKIMIAPSCSLLHVPVDASMEEALDKDLQRWLAYATEKLSEIRVLTQALNEGESSVAAELEENADIIRSRRAHPGVYKETVRKRIADISADDLRRNTPFEKRISAQQEHLALPLFPTTTIGSFPQTKEIRKVRAGFRKRSIPAQEYEQFMQEEIAKVVSFQEDAGLDVLVHGEAERNDMVEYFGEQLDGFFSTQYGWVQSYGSRCVKPPVIFADIQRPGEMTVRWSAYAQSLTELPVKGMLTGPTTILQWSFVRDDLARSEVTKQIALAVRDEVQDLEAAGISVIQVDEPAFREGLPLRKEDWPEYIEWATQCFRLATSGVKDRTQIHTHMCYSEFNEFVDAIAALDADVISIESSRSGMELLEAFAEVQYPNAIGPGVYDIHSPNIPERETVYALLKDALKVLRPSQLWVNPDCGLKTRKWKEVRPSLENMVAAAKELRRESARA